MNDSLKHLTLKINVQIFLSHVFLVFSTGLFKPFIRKIIIIKKNARKPEQVLSTTPSLKVKLFIIVLLLFSLNTR